MAQPSAVRPIKSATRTRRGDDACSERLPFATPLNSFGELRWNAQFVQDVQHSLTFWRLSVEAAEVVPVLQSKAIQEMATKLSEFGPEECGMEPPLRISLLGGNPAPRVAGRKQDVGESTGTSHKRFPIPSSSRLPPGKPTARLASLSAIALPMLLIVKRWKAKL